MGPYSTRTGEISDHDRDHWQKLEHGWSDRGYGHIKPAFAGSEQQPRGAKFSLHPYNIEQVPNFQVHPPTTTPVPHRTLEEKLRRRYPASNTSRRKQL
ncbi:hypothetical protein CC1G_01398 [Coprinopsis cinerea okayama7|uniref:Uncharacterized protein n=1 Tax=Coprinopsis cinerea (strain Okayama-7 / 130 / ATCC MYA-4618 / FGSC 9003) TaxID=240176 RepID=A8NYP7_COPC7|nr:hypothetical protein CC1G_01398 [Coprinopsis cinerea okayama7\|eukprot:XP_001837486.1 hypothetical protein CC1G_01398 [Coprinopsis cinerea okayama7\